MTSLPAKKTVRERITYALKLRAAQFYPHYFTSHRDHGTLRYFLHHNMPYPLDCAVVGHTPTFVEAGKWGWWECKRCTLRPHLTEEAKKWTAPTDPNELMMRAINENAVYWTPRRAESHLEISKSFTDQLSVSVKIGNSGSENTFAGHVIIPGWRGIYWGTSVLMHRVANWRSRRNKDSDRRYESLHWGFSIDKDAVRFKVASIEGSSHRNDPWYRNFSWSWRDALCGKAQYERIKVSPPTPVMIPMPEGLYPATLQAETATWKYKRFRKTKVSNSIDVKVKHGIATGRKGRGMVLGFGVGVQNRRKNCFEGFEVWGPHLVAARMLEDRANYQTADWVPPENARNEDMIPMTGEPAIRELVKALCHTVDYVGLETLPPIEGWSWYDALVRHDPNAADIYLATAQSIAQRAEGSKE